MRRISSFVLSALVIVSFSSLLTAQTKTREQIIEEIGAKRTELSALEEQFLSVPNADQQAFAELLSQPNTGLIRLLPREVFESEAYRKNKKTITMRGGGAYYSFTRLTNEYGNGSDIGLDHDYLSVGFAGCDYGMIAKLGDAAVEGLSASHPLVVPLTRHISASTEPGCRAEQRKSSGGTELEGLALSNRVLVAEKTTYLLRSINYGNSDVLVAFRIVRKDTDGSVIIAWKLIEKYSVPQLTRETDIAR